MSVRVVHLEPRKGAHRCDLPGFFARRRMNIGYGSIVFCPTCQRYWIWQADETGSYWSIDYRKVDQP